MPHFGRVFGDRTFEFKACVIGRDHLRLCLVHGLVLVNPQNGLIDPLNRNWLPDRDLRMRMFSPSQNHSTWRKIGQLCDF